MMIKDELEKIKEFCEVKIQQARYKIADKIAESEDARDMNYYIGIQHGVIDILHELNGIKTDV
jgi:hypothetical protein